MVLRKIISWATKAHLAGSRKIRYVASLLMERRLKTAFLHSLSFSISMISYLWVIKIRRVFREYNSQEPWTEAYISRLKKGKIFIDVGANVGDFTLIAAEKGTQVLAFEPNPQAYRILTKRTQHLNNIVCFNCALSDRDGMARLYVFKHAPFMSSINKPSDKYVTVNCRRLDDITSNLIRVDMIKIDVEGHEYKVLLGAMDTLKKHHPLLIVEIHGSECGQAVQDILSSTGYSVKIIHVGNSHDWIGGYYWVYAERRML